MKTLLKLFGGFCLWIMRRWKLLLFVLIFGAASPMLNRFTGCSIGIGGSGKGEGNGDETPTSEQQSPDSHQSKDSSSIRIEFVEGHYRVDGEKMNDFEQLKSTIKTMTDTSKSEGREIVFDLTSLSEDKGDSQERIRKWVEDCGAKTK